MTLKRIIVTGASGPLGVVLIEECIKRNIKVAAIVRPGSNKIKDIPKSDLVKIYEVDLREIDRFHHDLCHEKKQDELQGFDALIHFGWMYTENGRYDPLLQAENITTSLKTIEFAREIGCKVFIGAGSQAEYGPKSGPINEDTKETPVVAYGMAKLSAYHLLMEYGRCHDIRVNWVRIFTVYGPYENDYVLTAYLINSLLRGNIPKLTKCEQIWDYLYCEDAVRAFLEVAEKAKKSGLYCLGSGNARPLKEYVEIVRDSINPDLRLEFGAKEYGENQIMHLEANINKLQKEIGFKPKVSFEEGIRKTVDWYRERLEN